ncbi:hypothetical protein [Virgibacillus sp. JSM 102003]|uniref:hypothetical protein n=1 Tax=Virgibacillus sp. JSM 102003 TaxID=1562108 RepID=UPI0035C1DB16
MVKSLKGQFIISIAVAIGFLITSFSFIEFSGEGITLFNKRLFYFAMILSVFNAGFLTQKFFHKHKK